MNFFDTVLNNNDLMQGDKAFVTLTSTVRNVAETTRPIISHFAPNLLILVIRVIFQTIIKCIFEQYDTLSYGQLIKFQPSN